jgi:Protein of unknown function (DUF1190)
MTLTAAHHEDHHKQQSGRGVIVAVALLLILIGGMVGYGFLHRASSYALVLVTVDDCRRSFDDTQCRAIVERAQAIHADTAPSFADMKTCAMIYGDGGCAELKQSVIALHRYAPKLVAIALTPDRDGMVPVYFGPPGEGGGDPATVGRPVYFHGAMIGRLMQPKIGGADAPFIAGKDGNPLSADDIRALHGK